MKSRPRELKPSIKQLIIHRAITQRQIPREFLASEIIKQIEELGEVPPTLETAKRYISDARNTKNPLDRPWTTACCSEYSTFFPPEAISLVMEYKRELQYRINLSEEVRKKANEHRELFGFFLPDMTIRQAIWLVRLQPTINKIFAEDISKDVEARFAYTLFISMQYTIIELAFEILNHPLDTSGLDQALMNGNLERISELGALGMVSTLKPTNCDSKCDSCEKFMKIPGFKFCMPKPKKEKKDER